MNNDTSKSAPRPTRPSRLLLVTCISIFIAEAFVMLLISYLPPMSFLAEAIADALLLSILVFPFLYVFLFRPMAVYITDLSEALSKVETLKGLIPICSYCKKIRDDKGFWNILEGYISRHSQAEFTHGICPDCEDKLKEWDDDLNDTTLSL